MASGSKNRDSFVHLRLTNTAPTSHDKNLIYNIINGIDDEISQVYESITTLKRKLRKLKSMRAKHIKRRSEYTKILSPLRSMPVEILGEIFLHASAGSLSARLHVSHVCQLWRNAALATSELWSTVSVEFRRHEAELEYLRTCMRRARCRPLTFKLADCRDSFLEIMTVVAETSSCRWRDPSWSSLDLGIFEPLIELLTSTSNDTLENLTLGSHSWRGQDSKLNRHRPIHLAKLRKLHLYNSEELFSVITGALVSPVLEELVLDFEPDDANPGIIVHPAIFQILRANAENLRRLWISGISELQVCEYIIHLRLLEELSLIMYSNEDYAAFEALTVHSGNVPLPHLRSVRFVTSIDNHAQEWFFHLIKLRWWRASNEEQLQSKEFSRLRHASLQETFADSDLDLKLPMLAQFQREGLDLSYLDRVNGDDWRPNFKEFKD